jgi:hypothetical protein
LFVVVAILLVAGFAAQNWSEFTRTSPLTFGVLVEEAALGLVMLAVFGITLLVLIVSSAMQDSLYLAESRRHAKSLQAQRDLAEKAEASRFTDLRQQLDAHLRENRQRESMASSEVERAMIQSQRELRSQLDVINRTLDGRLTELESRIEARLERLQPAVPADVAQRDHVKA